MKFLCGNCKAKYQIADEKVSGKTLRMKCRRCGHDILIDGHNMPASNPPAPPAAAAASTRRTGPASVPVPTRGGSGAEPLPPRALPAALPRPQPIRSKPPSALGSEFRRHIAAPPEVPQRAPYDLWHVAIQDVPVGPMTRAELGRKIETGAVSAESLCWREGMDDWRPLGDLPELSQLLRRGLESSRSGRPPSQRRMPPVPGPPTPGVRSSGSHYPAGLEEIEEDYSEPTRVADAAHVSSGALQPVVQGPNTSGTSPKIVLPQQAVMAVAAEAPAAAPERPARGGSQMMAGLATGLVVGILLVGGPILYRNTWGSAPAPTPSQPVASEPAAAAKRVEVEEQQMQGEAPSEAKPSAAGHKTKVAATGVVPKPTKVDGKETKQLTPEEQALLNRMGVGGGGGVNLDGQRPRDTEHAAPSGPALTPTQLSKVVQDNKVQLQRCYETALRAAGGKQEGAIKVTVSVTVGTSGSTKLATTDGAGLGNMNECIRGAVKRWRFPQSGGESEFQFPLVFQPGA
jgi:predicted Zn finger-like uncharacterized protein